MLAHHRTLFVTWRGPRDGSMYFPVGRLREIADSSGNPAYEFTYIHGAHDAEKDGFRPFIEFPNLGAVYRSRELFPLFSNRLMPNSRPDYVEYVQRLGLTPTEIHPLDLLGRSMGARATDAIELFPLPVCLNGRYVTFFLLRGIRHRTPEQQARIEKLVAGEKLLPQPDARNAHDTYAVQLLTTSDGIFVGHVPSYLAEDVSRLCCENELPEVTVDRVNPSPAPVQHRVLCRLEAIWPVGFEPYSTPRYAPISAHAEALKNTAEKAAV